jgi:polyhydroxyalkanoate synthase
MGGALALPQALEAAFPWHPSLAAKAAGLLARMTAENRQPLQEKMMLEGGLRIEQILTGIRAYHNHPYRRGMAAPKTLASFGGSRLIDYGAAENPGDKPPVILCIPSLINPAYILDLGEKTSLLRFLAGQGFRPLLVDWGLPGMEEKTFTLTDYVEKRLTPMLEAAVKLGGGPVHLLGYCMGGNLAVALAERQQAKIKSMALLATPWDFHVASVTQARALSTAMSGIVAAFEGAGEVPVDFLQLFFMSLDPTLSDRKFRRFAQMDQTSPLAELFVAIEDWSNDGAPLAAKVARECLYEWYGENTPAKGLWRIGGEAVDPRRIQIPSLVVLPSSDRIVPPASARALGEALPMARIIEARSGHVAMIVSPEARNTLWQPLADWYKNPAP